jgi:hypothetical protein
LGRELCAFSGELCLTLSLLFGEVGAALLSGLALPAQPIELSARTIRGGFRCTQRPGEAIPLRGILGHLPANPLDFGS